MANQDIRQYAKTHGVKLWQIAAVLGISESTMTRRFRVELNEPEKQDMLRIIDEISETHKPAGDNPVKNATA